MTKKRKIGSDELSKSTQMIEEEQKIMHEEDPEEFEEVVEYEEVEVEEEEEEEEDEAEEEEYEEDEEEEGDEGEKVEELCEKVEQEPDQKDGCNDEVDNDEEPIQTVLSAFSKESLITLLSEAAERHPDVAARVRASAELDPSQRKIFIHGLNWDTTSEILIEEFQKYGEIEDCRLITDKATGRSKGYGFILFKTCRGARQALKEPQKMIHKRITSCQLASVGAGAAPLTQKQQPSDITQRKIYVSNVGAELDPVKLKIFFSRYGEIEEGPLGLDKMTGKPKGFCLFVYKTVESAKGALMEPHKQFEGVTLHCQQAIDGPKPQKTTTFQSRVEKNQEFVDSVIPSVVNPPLMHTFVQAPLGQHPQQPLDVNAAALGQVLTALMTAQGAGLNLLGPLGGGTGLGHYPGVVPGFGSEVMQGGYGNGAIGASGGVNMGPDQDQGRNPTWQKRRRGGGR